MKIDAKIVKINRIMAKFVASVQSRGRSRDTQMVEYLLGLVQ